MWWKSGSTTLNLLRQESESGILVQQFGTQYLEVLDKRWYRVSLVQAPVLEGSATAANAVPLAPKGCKLALEAGKKAAEENAGTII